MKIRADQLSNQLQKSLAPIYLVSGNEPLLVDETCAVIRNKAKEAGIEERIVFDVTPQFSWEVFYTELQSLSLFSPRQIIELRMPTGKPGLKGAEVLLRYAENATLSNKLLIIVCEKLDGTIQRSKWFKAIDSAGIILQIWPVAQPQLPYWIKQRAQDFGLDVSLEGSQLLAEYVRGNLLAASQEIEKLKLIYGIGPIDAKQVAQCVVESSHFDIFDLAASLLAGDINLSLRILRALQEQRVEPTLILWVVVKNLRDLIQLAFAKEKGHSLPETLQSLGIWEKQKNQMLQAAQKFSLRKWLKIYQRAVQIELVIKGVDVGDPWAQCARLCILIAAYP